MKLFERARQELMKRLSAICDVDPKSPLVSKNPNHDAHDTVPLLNKEWTLKELQDALNEMQLAEMPETTIASDDAPETNAARERQRDVYRRAHGQYYDHDNAVLGRNCAAFEAVRGLVYAAKEHCCSEDELALYALEQVGDYNQINNAADLMSEKECEHIAISIAEWTWRRYERGEERCDRGACKKAGLIHAGIVGKKRKQAIGGKYGAKKNAENNLERVTAARNELIDAGKDVTVSGLAKTLKMSRTTVRKHLNTLQEVQSEHPVQGVVNTVPFRNTYRKNMLGLPTRDIPRDSYTADSAENVEQDCLYRYMTAEEFVDELEGITYQPNSWSPDRAQRT